MISKATAERLPRREIALCNFCHRWTSIPPTIRASMRAGHLHGRTRAFPTEDRQVVRHLDGAKNSSPDRTTWQNKATGHERSGWILMFEICFCRRKSWSLIHVIVLHVGLWWCLLAIRHQHPWVNGLCNICCRHGYYAFVHWM